ncbi:MAG: manganese efflux pump MntP family protein [Petrimonas sp.]|nr:manganese efflux pump MntP family protein [Petrimonas sp.]HMM17573.1 manganese efflux pump MntP family protein [Petrimonas sp.]
MDYISIMLIAIGLAMDSFAVCVGKGMCRQRFYLWRSLKVAAVFGLFQGLMPFVGYVLGISFASWMQLFDHWFAFFILSVIGIKMIYESFISKPHEVCVGCDCQEDIVVDWRKVVVLAFATSIDAMATGLVFVSYPGTISTATITIGLVTLFFAFSGMFIGVRFGRRLRLNIEMLGGIILIAIGMKILFQHLLHGA